VILLPLVLELFVPSRRPSRLASLVSLLRAFLVPP
jgi:hypothetical protein